MFYIKLRGQLIKGKNSSGKGVSRNLRVLLKCQG